jgi:3-methyladenine DNA glycosylase AlkC
MPELLKNIFYGEKYFDQLAKDVKKVYKTFDDNKFIKLIFDSQWRNFELKERMHHTAKCIHQLLPEKYNEALKILLKVVTRERSKHPQFFEDMCFADYVEMYGIDYPEISIPALGIFTQYSSSEFAVRPFIIKYPELTMKHLLEWTNHPNHHVRRFASEGCRPRLPWAIALPAFKKNPSPILPVLDALKNDESEYVRRSVANNLNDISKDNPEIVLSIGKKWIGKNKNTDWVVKHALRTLLKKGNSEAMRMFGFGDNKNFKIEKFRLAKNKIEVGSALSFSFSLQNTSSKILKLRIEYNIYYVKAKGKISKKIFQITKNSFKPGESVLFRKKQSFKDMTTRKHNPGKHKLGIVINGREVITKDFLVVK